MHRIIEFTCISQTRHHVFHVQITVYMACHLEAGEAEPRDKTEKQQAQEQCCSDRLRKSNATLLLLKRQWAAAGCVGQQRALRGSNTC